MKKEDVKKHGLVIDDDEVEGAEVPGDHNRILKVLMSPEVGNYDEGTILLSDIQPGKSTGMHTHDADEIMYVASGYGYNECGGKKNEIEEGSTIFAPADVEHDIVNESDEVLRLFCVYIPSIEPAGKFLEATENMKGKFEEM